MLEHCGAIIVNWILFILTIVAVLPHKVIWALVLSNGNPHPETIIYWPPLLFPEVGATEEAAKLTVTGVTEGGLYT